MLDKKPVDLTVPSAARMYDWLLGGSNNFDVDKVACQLLLEAAPTTKALALNNRWFLERVVRVLAEEHGIRQFIDFGSGLPTQNNVHQIAQAVDPSSRVVYVDNDPVVLGYGKSLLDENDRTAIVGSDMADTEFIFNHPEFEHLINLDEPAAALFVSVLHCLPDAAKPGALVRRVIDKLKPGSFVVICHLVSDSSRLRSQVTDLMLELTHGNWGRVRTESDVHGYFQGLDVKRPGLVDVTDWRPDSDLRQRQRSIEWTEYGGLAEIPEE
ncbi:SAM-dependent methyltransferase [Streptomyces sp. WZ.A104]|uniref:SAM-dependent methyltransferase n=1 Tax=Streptomyces sp. WZ.A104 TaxID=2023771 RepID=UPI00211CA905|nr:SAM-dependent methyltransferase [Streptomyces sp. WZ.A104]